MLNEDVKIETLVGPKPMNTVVMANFYKLGSSIPETEVQTVLWRTIHEDELEKLLDPTLIKTKLEYEIIEDNPPWEEIIVLGKGFIN